MKNISWLFALFILLTGTSCKEKLGETTLSSLSGKKYDHAQVHSVRFENDQLIIDGEGLNQATGLKLKNNSIAFNEDFTIESQNDHQIIANGIRNISIAVGAVMELVISSAHGASSYSVSFELSQNDASTGDVLVYNGSSWIPQALNGLVYQGTFNPTTGCNNPTGNAGDYYVISTNECSGENIGDWLVYNGVAWEHVPMSAAGGGSGDFMADGSVSMTGALDMGLSQIINASSLQLTDGGIGVSLQAPNAVGTNYVLTLPVDAGTTGQVLTTDGAGVLSWSASGGLAAGSVTTTEIQDGTILNADISATANIEQSKIFNLTTDLGNITNDVTTNANNISSNTAAIGGKAPNPGTACGAGNKLQWDGTAFTCVADLNTDTNASTLCAAGEYLDGGGTCIVLNTDNVVEGAANLYYTSVRAIADLIEGAAITEGETSKAPSSDLVFDALALKQDKMQPTDNIRLNSFTSDGQDGLSLNPYGTMPGQTGESRFLELNANGINYVGLKAPDAIAADLVWTLPATDGALGEVLTTNGAGELSWGAGGGSGVTSVTVNAPLVDSGAAATPDISLTQASTTTAGYLSSDDWNMFNNKQNSITPGTIAQYLRGDLSLATFGDDVRSTPLTGFASGAGAVVATDSILAAVQKLDGNIAGKENAIVGGTVTQYYRGDKSWETLDKAAVGLGSVDNVEQMPLSYLSIDTLMGGATPSDAQVSSQNAVKTYVDTEVSGLASQYVNVTGDTMTGALDLAGNNLFLGTGNIGIGTNTPSQMLHLFSSSTPTALIQSGDLSMPTLKFKGGGSTGPLGTVVFESAGAFDLAKIEGRSLAAGSGELWFYTKDGGASTERMRISSNGNVGLGTTVPTDKLDVAGDIRVGTAGSNGCVKNAGGGVIIGTCSSDKRFKKDIRSFEKTVEKLSKLTPTRYFWRKEEFPNKHFGDEEQIGLIAQEVAKVFPELVVVDEDGYFRVRYTELNMHMLQGIKEHHQEIKSLNREIASLKLKADNQKIQARQKGQQIAELKTENAALKERLDKIEKALNLK